MGHEAKLHGSNPEPPMSALGQKRTLADVRVMSALPPKADITVGASKIRSPGWRSTTLANMQRDFEGMLDPLRVAKRISIQMISSDRSE